MDAWSERYFAGFLWHGAATLRDMMRKWGPCLRQIHFRLRAEQQLAEQRGSKPDFWVGSVCLPKGCAKDSSHGASTAAETSDDAGLVTISKT